MMEQNENNVNERMSPADEIREYFQRVGKVFVNERPEGMSVEAYKIIRERQNYAIKKYKKGKMVHVSSTVEFADGANGKPKKVKRTNTYFKPNS